MKTSSRLVDTRLFRPEFVAANIPADDIGAIDAPDLIAGGGVFSREWISSPGEFDAFPISNLRDGAFVQK